MRMLLLFILLLTQLPTIAKGSTCDNFNNPSFDGPACVAEPGCMVEGGTCIQCNTGYYCPANASGVCSSTNGACDCPAPFTATMTGGVTSVEGCYIKLTQCVDEHNLSEPFYIGCDDWDNSTCSLNLTAYTPQRNETITTSGVYSRQTYASPTPDQSGNLSNVEWFLENGYHLELKPIFAEHPAPPTHPNIIFPVSFDIVCVPDNRACGEFRTFSQYDNDDFNPNTPAHVAAFNTTVGAPPTDLSFSMNSSTFTMSGTNCPNGATFPTNKFAHWVPGDSNTPPYWDVSDCQCNLEDELTDAKCYGYGFKNANVSTSNPVNTVHSIYENIIYEEELNGTSYCTRCKADTDTVTYFVLHGYDATEHKVTFCNSTAEANDFRKKGYYLQHSCDTPWENPTALTANPCPRTACTGAGKTTLTVLPIGTEDNVCQYTDQTQFCDANGCFTLNPGEWDFD